jgi:tetratricopeptide (TPR) repeat protein
MAAPSASVEQLLDLAIRHVNAGQRERARVLCEQADVAHPPHPAVRQLLAVLSLLDGDVVQARHHAEASLALRPDHVPTLVVAGTAQHQGGHWPVALRTLERAVALDPGHADGWFQLALVQHDLRDLEAAAQSLRCVLRLAPDRVDAATNLGIVLQDSGRIDAAMRAYGRAYRLREDSFGRIAHALAAASNGRLWLDLDALRATLRATPA